jgi:hypothetical protein
LGELPENGTLGELSKIGTLGEPSGRTWGNQSGRMTERRLKMLSKNPLKLRLVREYFFGNRDYQTFRIVRFGFQKYRASLDNSSTLLCWKARSSKNLLFTEIGKKKARSSKNWVEQKTLKQIALRYKQYKKQSTPPGGQSNKQIRP